MRQSDPGKSGNIPLLSAADPDDLWPRSSNPPRMHCRQQKRINTKKENRKVDIKYRI